MEHTSEFQGFSPETLDFLWGLRFNNNKDWFLAHKTAYEQTLLQPIRALSAQLRRWLNDRDGADVWSVHLSRIYRDARRLYGRGPMQDHLWFTLFRSEQEYGHPAFYFTCTPEGCSYGMGMWDVSAEVMVRYRQRLQRTPEVFLPLAQRFAAQDRLVLDGPRYVRRKADVGPALQDWFDLRRVGISRAAVPAELAFSPALAEEMQRDFTFLTPYFQFLESVADGE